MKLFEMGDTNRNGFAEIEEFREGYKHEDPEVDDGAINDAFFIADSNQDGKVSKEEFLALKQVIGSPILRIFV